MKVFKNANTVQPRRVQESAVIGIFTPSEPITDGRAQRFAAGIQLLESKGFSVKLADNVRASDAYAAGTAEMRARDIRQLAAADDIDILLAGWGGKSANQLVPLLDYDLIRRVRKPVLGFSDAAVVLNAIAERTGLVTFYGPNVVGKLNETQHAGMDLLKTGSSANLLGRTESIEKQVLSGGRCKGILFGGNLSTIVLGGLLGGALHRLSRGGIFFWEEPNMPAQILDQYLTALDNAGILSSLSGMVVGDYQREDSDEWKRAESADIIRRTAGAYGYPILYCPTFGHGDFENPLIPIGLTCELDADRYELRPLDEIVE